MTAMRYRLAAFDIDGTLVGPSGTLSPAGIAAGGGLAARGGRLAPPPGRAVAGTAGGASRRLPASEAPVAGPATTVASLTEVALDRAYVVAPFTGPDDPAFPTLEALVRDAGLRGERALTSAGREIVAVTHADAGKGPALHRLCEALGIPPPETAAFGDTEVDLPMIKLAGLGVAMGDAPEPVQAAANMVAGTALEDGVATAIGRIWGEG